MEIEAVHRRIFYVIIILVTYILFGSAVYSWLEGWSWIDSFYFSSMTISTIGYGDFVPTTTISKLFTIIYAFIGIGILFYSVGVMGKEYVEKEERRLAHIFDRAIGKSSDPKEPGLIHELEQDLLHRTKKKHPLPEGFKKK